MPHSRTEEQNNSVLTILGGYVGALSSDRNCFSLQIAPRRDWTTSCAIQQPKLGKVSNVVKAELEETLRSAKTALEEMAVQKEIEADELDVTMPG